MIKVAINIYQTLKHLSKVKKKKKRFINSHKMEYTHILYILTT